MRDISRGKLILFLNAGDDGKIEIESSGLIKETESTYTLWCSGRTCCEGMLVELKFIKVNQVNKNHITSFKFIVIFIYFRDKI